MQERTHVVSHIFPYFYIKYHFFPTYIPYFTVFCFDSPLFSFFAIPDRLRPGISGFKVLRFSFPFFPFYSKMDVKKNTDTRRTLLCSKT